MSAAGDLLRRAAHRHRCRRARLPWKALEAEATRQGCSGADIFFDWAGGTLDPALLTGTPENQAQASIRSQADPSTS
jgi:hypothetical protein